MVKNDHTLIKVDGSNVAKRTKSSTLGHNNNNNNKCEAKKRKALPVKKLLEMERTKSEQNEQIMVIKRGKLELENEQEDEDKKVSTSSILGSLEKMVEMSFNANKNANKTSSVTNSGILGRLGIEEEDEDGANSPISLIKPNEQILNSPLGQLLRAKMEEQNDGDQSSEEETETELRLGRKRKIKKRVNQDQIKNEQETAQSKFIKYSQLARQLSSS